MKRWFSTVAVALEIIESLENIYIYIHDAARLIEENRLFRIFLRFLQTNRLSVKYFFFFFF